VPAVDKNGQLDCSRSPEINDLVQRCPDRAARKQYIINQNDIAINDRKEYVGSLNNRLVKLGVDVVAIEADIHQADRHLDSLQALDYPGDSLREMRSAGEDANNDKRFRTGIVLENLMSDAREGSAYFFLIEDGI
jgi:hypothetical protein